MGFASPQINANAAIILEDHIATRHVLRDFGEIIAVINACVKMTQHVILTMEIVLVQVVLLEDIVRINVLLAGMDKIVRKNASAKMVNAIILLVNAAVIQVGWVLYVTKNVRWEHMVSIAN